MNKIFLFVCTLLLSNFAIADIEIKDPYVPVAPPGAMAYAAYFTVTNNGEQVRELIGIESGSFGAVHLHHTKMKDGVASMMSVSGIVLKPGESVTLEPGAMHVMLMKPKREDLKLMSVPLVLLFKNGEKMEFTAPIKTMN